METVATGFPFPFPIPDGPFFDVLSRLSIKDLHRATRLSREWRDVFINFPDSRKNLLQTLQGFFYIDGRDVDDGDDGSGSSVGGYGGGDDDEDRSGKTNGNDDWNTDDGDGSGNNAYGDSYYGGDVDDGKCDDDNGDVNSCGGDRNDGGGEGDGDEDGDDGSSDSNDNDDDRVHRDNKDGAGTGGNGNADIYYSGGGGDGCADDDGGVDRRHGSARSGNCGLRFLDLLPKSMPVPDDIDTEFSFLALPLASIGSIDLLCSCNGLLLIGCKQDSSEDYHSLGYIVCNPATKQWVTVPSSGWVLTDESGEEFETTFLFFDPAAVPSHFLLIQFWHDEDAALNLPGHEAVHIYSSQTGEWSNRSSEWMQFGSEGDQWGDGYGVAVRPSPGSCFLNGMLHFFVDRMREQDVLIVAVDGQGSIRRIMHWPVPMLTEEAVFIGQSQGRLHCIRADFERRGDQRHTTVMSIDVLQNYDAEEWQKGRCNIQGGELSAGGKKFRRQDFEVVSIHPDGDLVYIFNRKNGELIQYDMGGTYPEEEQVLRLCSLGHGYRSAVTPYVSTPYVPCFSRSSALENKERRLQKTHCESAGILTSNEFWSR